MKRYVKPSVQVIELQLKENIAAIPTTVHIGATANATNTSSAAFQLALSQANIGFTAVEAGVFES